MCTVHRTCVVPKLPIPVLGKEIPSLFFCDFISAVPVVGGERMSTLSSTLQIISFLGALASLPFFYGRILSVGYDLPEK